MTDGDTETQAESSDACGAARGGALAGATLGTDCPDGVLGIDDPQPMSLVMRYADATARKFEQDLQ